MLLQAPAALLQSQLRSLHHLLVFRGFRPFTGAPCWHLHQAIRAAVQAPQPHFTSLRPHALFVPATSISGVPTSPKWVVGRGRKREREYDVTRIYVTFLFL